MFLTDKAIAEKIHLGEIRLVDPDGRDVIDPNTKQEREPGQLDAHGYELRVRKVYSWRAGREIDLEREVAYRVQPGEFIVIESYEGIMLGKRIAATVHSLARMTLLGFSHISTTIHPGWSMGENKPAPIDVALSNLGKVSQEIKYRERFCRLIFYEAPEEASGQAPSLEQVTANFNYAKRKIEERYNIRRVWQGWVLFVFAIVLAIVFLYYVTFNFPNLTEAAFALVAAALPVTFAVLRRWFNIV